MTLGRPTKYQGEETCRQAIKLCEMGAIDKDLAEFFQVNVDTINEWKNVYPKFSDSLKKGKENPDAQVVQSLYKRANGSSHPAVKIFNHEGTALKVDYTERFPPDTTACIFWLKNRRPAEWRDRIEQVIDDKRDVVISDKPLTTDEFTKKYNVDSKE